MASAESGLWACPPCCQSIPSYAVNEEYKLLRSVKECDSRGDVRRREGGAEGRGATRNATFWVLDLAELAARPRAYRFLPYAYTPPPSRESDKWTGYGSVRNPRAERGAMEQDPPNAVASTSEGDGGDSSVGRAKSNNQEEEQEEQERADSAYGSGDFDEQSKAGGSESEVRVYQFACTAKKSNTVCTYICTGSSVHAGDIASHEQSSNPTLVRNLKHPPRLSPFSYISRLSGIDRTRLQPWKYDSRDYGFDEDDQSSISPTTEDGSATRTTETGGGGGGGGGSGATGSPTTEDGSATRTTETGGGDGGSGATEGGEGGERQGAGNTAVAGGETVALGEQNSLSSYADDFADDESIIPPKQHTTTAAAPVSSEKPSAVSTTDADSSRGGDTATQQGAGDRSQHSPASDVPASSQDASSESNTEDNTNGGEVRIGSNQEDSKKSRDGNAGVDQRRLSGSANSRGSSLGGDGGRGAASKVDSSPSVSELEDRLREADLENARLREAMEKSAAASTEGDGDNRRELEILKGQVEAAK